MGINSNVLPGAVTPPCCVETPQPAINVWFEALSVCLQVVVAIFVLFAHWWSPLCFAIGSVAQLWSQLIFPVAASSCDGRIIHTDEIDKDTGFVTRTSTYVLATYY